MPVTVLVLGPFEVRRAGRAVEVVGSRLRCLLVRLALDTGSAVGTKALIDAVWEDDPPAGAANALQTLVSRLRRSLGDAALVQQTPSGYRLAIDPASVDVHAFELAAREGSAALLAGDPERALTHLDDALGRWRGQPLADIAERQFLETAAGRLAEIRLGAAIDRIEAELTLGRADHVVADAGSLAVSYPGHERLARLLMSALYATGRRGDALATYERLRAQLADDFGTDPSPDSTDMHLAVLRGTLSVVPARAFTAAEPPPEPAARAVLTNLRAQLSSFIGRDSELARITDLLAANRLVTLIGPGGAGKTRLAAEAARRWVDEVPDGVWFVELAPVNNAANLAQAVLDSLGLSESHVLERPGKIASRDALQQLLDAMADKHTVLVLDNCEHLISGVARLVDLLLARNAELRIVATSREPLGIVGEALTVVPPLDQPAPDAGHALALTFPAVQLFAVRAAAVSPGFEVDAHTVAAVIEICRRLDGLPLAIELAAARLRSLPVEQIAARLDDRFRLLTGGSRTAMPRHRTLRAVVEWSWDLLTDPERRLAERLAVFPAGTTPGSAEATCADDQLPAGDVFDLLAALVDRSLLQLVDTDEPRYRMLETIREYGIERLAERGELEWIRRSHAAFFGGLAHDAAPFLRTADQLSWMDRLTIERDNLLAALRYLGDSGDAAAALALATDLSWYWMLRGNHAEAANWLGFSLQTAGVADPDLVLIAQAAYVMNSVAWFGPQTEGMAPSLDEIAEKLLTVDSNRDPLLTILKPMLLLFSNQAARVGPLIDEAVAAEDPWARAAALMLRANINENDGEIEAMRGDLGEALVAFRAIGDRWGLASVLVMLGGLRTRDGDLDAAVDAFVEARDLMRMIGADDDGVVLSLQVAELRLRRGEVELARAETAHVRALGPRGSPLHRILVDTFSARIARQSGEVAQAAAFLAAATERFDSVIGSTAGIGQLRSLILATSVLISIDLGQLDGIDTWASEAYQVAASTKDMPVLGTVGIAIAALAAHHGAATDAATVLGAAARLSGSADETNLDIASLTGALRSVLGGADFDTAYAQGRAMTKDAAIARLDPRLVTTDGQALLR